MSTSLISALDELHDRIMASFWLPPHLVSWQREPAKGGSMISRELIQLAGGLVDRKKGADIALHDALVEHGYPHAAAKHFGVTLAKGMLRCADTPKACDLVRTILGLWSCPAQTERYTLEWWEADGKSWLIQYGYLPKEDA